MTHQSFKVACALAQMLGLPQATGMSPAECIKAMVDMREAQVQQRNGDQAAPVARADDPRQLKLFGS